MGGFTGPGAQCLQYGDLADQPKLDASLLARSAAVVRDRRDVFDQLDLQAGGLQRSDRVFAATARAFDANFNFANAELLRLLSTLLSCHLTGERSALATALEPARASAGPAQGLTLGICDGDRGVIEGRVDVGNARNHVAALLFLGFNF